MGRNHGAGPSVSRLQLNAAGPPPGPFVVLASTFNATITTALSRGAVETLTRSGIPSSAIHLIRVPGAFELPGAAASIAESLRPRAIIAVGCVIKGETPQYAALGQAVMHGLIQVSVDAKIPVTCGLIIADSLAQARQRAGGRVGNRGREAAEAALAMASLLQQLPRRV